MALHGSNAHAKQASLLVSKAQAAQRVQPNLEPLLSFALLYEHRLEHIIDLLGWSILAVPHPNASQQDEPLDALLCCSLYQIDVALHTTQVSTLLESILIA